ncbi:hypothetical protein BDV27DRAFT_125563 [Aspergillus caelatus]|uniref:Uncharacterized protein n=1 Tax=Aspergillus caelatus TaxID=61420 RepID=A0A5N7AA54_9EURO|nr:uncharacterized protein BDV27DRAFT_125563 [Aspergillus caelatus]KAE8366248.1 hypothetical protein BDV27DRAFT_125563 [Aspergillus caelatus]
MIPCHVLSGSTVSSVAALQCSRDDVNPPPHTQRWILSLAAAPLRGALDALEVECLQMEYSRCTGEKMDLEKRPALTR